MYENCPFCMSLEVCTTNTEVLLVLKTLFNTSLLHAHMCDTDATESLTITLNTPTALQTERMGYSFDCSICEDGRHNIHYYIARSTFTNVSSCGKLHLYVKLLYICVHECMRLFLYLCMYPVSTCMCLHTVIIMLTYIYVCIVLYICASVHACMYVQCIFIIMNIFYSKLQYIIQIHNHFNDNFISTCRSVIFSK